MPVAPVSVNWHSHAPGKDGRNIEVVRGETAIRLNDKEAVQLALSLLRSTKTRI